MISPQHSYSSRFSLVLWLVTRRSRRFTRRPATVCVLCAASVTTTSPSESMAAEPRPSSTHLAMMRSSAMSSVLGRQPIVRHTLVCTAGSSCRGRGASDTALKCLVDKHRHADTQR